MRILPLCGTAMLALCAADAASAQRMVAHGPAAPAVPHAAPMGMHGGGVRPMPGPGPRPAGGWHGNRWGSRVGGRWWAGSNAPGGWRAYRRPTRGWALPAYWISPQFYISDWSSYGLSQPPYGYNWARYYDDAVLIDSRGSVYDSIDGIDWDRGGYEYGDDGYAAPGAGYAAPDGGYYADDRVYAAPAPAAGGYYERRDNGVGGALAGAAVGGVAGNLIAGRGNRLGGTLIGAGVGAAAGYAIDKAEDRHRRVPVAPAYAPPPPAGYGEAYAPPPPPPPAPYPGRPVGGPGGWTSPDGRTTVVTTSAGGYYGAGTTTVTVQTAPVVTTTTTEIYEDAVTYSAPKKVYRKRVWRAKPRCSCR